MKKNSIIGVAVSVSVVSLWITITAVGNPLVCFTAAGAFIESLIVVLYMAAGLMLMSVANKKNYKRFEGLSKKLSNALFIIVLIAFAIGMWYDAFETKCGLSASLPTTATIMAAVCGSILDDAYYKRFGVESTI